jgi:polysaccharide biosynthesis transport protein
MDQPNPYNLPPQNNGRAVIADPSGGYAGVPMDYQRPGGGYPHYPQIELAEENVGFDFYKYLRIITKYRWLIVGVTTTTLAIAVVLTFLMTPIYRATSSIQIDREAMNVIKVDGIQPDERLGGNEFYQTQYELLASRSLAERVVTTLNLAGDSQFSIKSKTLVGTLKDLVLAGGNSDGSSAKNTPEARAAAAVSRLGQVLSVAPVRGSRIVKINVDHPDPQVAQRVANGFAEVFIADNLDRRYDATSYARKFLEDRLQQLKVKLEDSERQAVKYAEEQGIINVDEDKNLSATDLIATNEKLAEVRSDRIKKELLWKQAQATSGLGLKEILDNPAIQENQKLRTQLAAEYQQKLAVYKPAFPEMMQLRNQIKELDRQVQTEAAAIKMSIKAGYLAAKEEEENLQAQLASGKTDVVDQRNRSIQYNILKREVDTNRQLYDGLLQRYKEIGVAGGVGTNNISIVDQATAPSSPRSPNLPLNVVLGLAAGLLFGCLLALALDYLDDSFKAPEDIERELGLSVIGVVPKPQIGTSIEEELSDARSGMSEAYRSLRTSLQFSTSEGLPRTLLVTSSKPSEGKTTTTIYLARTLAHIGLNVLLIDGDLRNSSVHKRMGQSNELGLSNYLSGSRMPEDVVQATDTDRLVVMTSGPLPPNPAELLSGPKFPALMTLAAESFDVVLIDGPPVMGLADAPLLSSMVQATMLVIAANETRRSTVRIALKRLQFARANIVGTLLNKFDVKQTGYGYGYGYGDYNYHSYGTKELPDLR